uniref:Uncharacterized protein n=1 Tax=viral metagenome TaxID=1070528 RepID=A0A6C0BPE0_9ZZZZ
MPQRKAYQTAVAGITFRFGGDILKAQPNE